MKVFEFIEKKELINKIANELAKANNTNSGKHMADYVEKFEEE